METRNENTIPLKGWRRTADLPRGFADCCLIVATYRRPGDINKQLLALAQVEDNPAEVVIVDGSPDDETEKVILNVCRDVKLPFELVYVRSPKGLTRQRNVGIDVCTREFVFFLDDDALPLEWYFTEVRQIFLQDPEKTIGATAAHIVNEMNRPTTRRWRIRRAIGLIPRTEPLKYNDVGTSTPGSLLKPEPGLSDVDVFTGAAFAVRREVFEHMRFSEFFAGYSWGEDLEMSLRIRRKWRVVFCGDARVWHFKAPAARPPAFSKGRMEVRNRYFIWRRYSPKASLVNRIRFFLDLAFIFLMDVAWFVARPWRHQHFSHAIGVQMGALSCVVSPPHCVEPAPERRYRLLMDSECDREVQCQSRSI